MTRHGPRTLELEALSGEYAVCRLPADLDCVLALALAKDPVDRFDSGAEFADALAKAARGRLPSHLRDRADDALRRHPWSTS